MQKYLLDKNWGYVEADLMNPLMVGMLNGWKTTDLPHDYAMEKERSKNAPGGLDEGFTQGAGLYYKKSFEVDKAAAGKRFWLEFEGVAGATEIWVNKKFVGKHSNPYTSFWIEVSDQFQIGENEVVLHTDNRAKPNSRWYVGAGIYRHVWLHMAEKATVRPYGLRVTTKTLADGKAVLDICAELAGTAEQVRFVLKDKAGTELADVSAVLSGDTAKAELSADGITPWSLTVPELYLVEAQVTADGTTDIASVRIGIRTIEVDSQDGFRLNGLPMKLQGGCIHHDLGLLGAADFDAAERRRIRLLKESGFNALRLAHNPFGPSIFKACDELGMLVVEEAFDEWVLGRTSFGLHVTFEDRWERDLEDMISRDYNHPSIIMWSTGNEVEERDGSADGFGWSRRLADKVRQLDSSRPVSATACALFTEYTQRPAAGSDGTTGNQALNMAYDNFASGVDIWGDTTAPYFAPLDVAGYNYKTARYSHDAVKFPDRVIYGAESYPRAAFLSWQGAQQNANVIGDFVWTAWDYIGEVGVGRWEVSEAPRPGQPKWPWLLANCSDFDVIGQKRPQSYYRDVLWGMVKGPRLFVLPPQLTGKNIARLSWAWLPVQRSYTFPDSEGEMVEINIYADADEVELLQNGVSIGRKPCTAEQEYIAVFSVPYRPGKLTAVAYIDGREIGRDSLATTGKTTKLMLTADRSVINADSGDLCFIHIQATDQNGLPVYTENGDVTITMQGGGKLLAFGNADPKPDRLLPYTQPACPLYNGEALAIVRGEDDVKECMIQADLENGIQAQLAIGFTRPVDETAALIKEIKAGPLDLPLAELLQNTKAVAVLREHMGAMLDNPMLKEISGLSLKKIIVMGGQSLPEKLAEALEEAFK